MKNRIKFFYQAWVAPWLEFLPRFFYKQWTKNKREQLKKVAQPEGSCVHGFKQLQVVKYKGNTKCEYCGKKLSECQLEDKIRKQITAEYFKN